MPNSWGEITNVEALKKFFEADGGRKITMEELKALSVDERKELADLCREQLNKTN